MRAWAAFVVVIPVLLAAGSASAYTHTGNTYFLVTGDFCIGCHIQGTVPPPTIDVTQVTPDPLTIGGSAVFQVKLHSGRADFSSSFAGFAAGVDDKAGTFKAGTDADHETELCGNGGAFDTCPLSGGKTFTALRDVSLRPWDADGTYTWQIELDDLGPGTFNLFVGGNDANGDGLDSGDHNNHNKLSFTVPGGAGEGEGGEGEGAAEGEGAGDEGEGEGTPPPPGGCDAAATGHGVPAASMLAFGLLTVVGFRRRRPSARRGC